MNDETLADIIAEIFDGVTVLNSSFGPIYVRHFGQLELRRTFSQKRKFLKDASSRGLMTEKESLDLLYADEMWSKDSEESIVKKRQFIENLNNGLTRIKIPSKREQHKKMIKKEIEILENLENERAELLGLTAEKYAQKKVNQRFFENLLFEDKDFKKSVFDDLDGIGPERKKILKNHFGSIEQMKLASMEELREVKSIPEKILKKIYEYFHSL